MAVSPSHPMKIREQLIAPRKTVWVPTHNTQSHRMHRTVRTHGTLQCHVEHCYMFRSLMASPSGDNTVSFVLLSTVSWLPTLHCMNNVKYFSIFQCFSFFCRTTAMGLALFTSTPWTPRGTTRRPVFQLSNSSDAPIHWTVRVTYFLGRPHEFEKPRSTNPRQVTDKCAKMQELVREMSGAEGVNTVTSVARIGNTWIDSVCRRSTETKITGQRPRDHIPCYGVSRGIRPLS
jgi:hypothetical protein